MSQLTVDMERWSEIEAAHAEALEETLEHQQTYSLRLAMSFSKLVETNAVLVKALRSGKNVPGVLRDHWLSISNVGDAIIALNENLMKGGQEYIEYNEKITSLIEDGVEIFE